MAVLPKRSSPLGGTPPRVSPGVYRDPMGGLIKSPTKPGNLNSGIGISSGPNIPRPLPGGFGTKTPQPIPPPTPNLGLLPGGGEPGNSPTGGSVDWNKFGDALGGGQGMPQQPIPYGNDGIAPKPIPYGNDGIMPPTPKSPYDLSGDMVQPGGGAPIRPLPIPSTMREGQAPIATQQAPGGGLGAPQFNTGGNALAPRPFGVNAQPRGASGGISSYGADLAPETRQDKFQKPQPKYKPTGGNPVGGYDKWGKPVYDGTKQKPKVKPRR